MKKKTLIIGALMFLVFYAFTTENCKSCFGTGKYTQKSNSVCTICKGKTTLQCQDEKYLSSRRFINNNLDESYYDCKGGRYKIRRGYADYFDVDGDICDYCNGTAKVECGRCEGFGFISSSKSQSHEICKGEGKVSKIKNWLN